MDYGSLVHETADHLGISDAQQIPNLLPYVKTAVELCTAQTGQQDFSGCESAKRYVIYTAAQMYADRLGELNNKQGSAAAQAMQNISFVLQTKNRRAANHENNDSA